MTIQNEYMSFINWGTISSSYDLQVLQQHSQKRCCFSQTAQLWFEVLPDLWPVLPGMSPALHRYSLALPGYSPALPRATRSNQSSLRRSEMIRNLQQWHQVGQILHSLITIAVNTILWSIKIHLYNGILKARSWSGSGRIVSLCGPM